MTAIKQPYQELFDYLANELNVIALLTQMHEIEAIINENHKQQIKDAYNQGYREGLEDFYLKDEFNDVLEHSNAENYYNQTFNK
jgi:flagellar biosynthesis/type III secretory pathway protein FliH